MVTDHRLYSFTSSVGPCDAHKYQGLRRGRLPPPERGGQGLGISKKAQALAEKKSESSFESFVIIPFSRFS